MKKILMALARRSRQAARALAATPRARKDKALRAMANALRRQRPTILRANRNDLAVAKRAKRSPAMTDRLMLDEKRLEGMARAVEAVAALDDWVGRVDGRWERPNGLLIEKVRVPIGVIAVVYESRPNVTSECASLCIKSGNAVILKGGHEAFQSNRAILKALREGLRQAGLPMGAIQGVPSMDRRALDHLLAMDRYIDLVIPRGGESLIERVTSRARMPVIKHAKGVCHAYVDRQADLKMARRICLNAKVQRPGVCNAMETLLVHRDVARSFLPDMVKQYRQAGVEIRGCPQTRRWVRVDRPATATDWTTEYLDLILSIRVVDSLDQAIDHINRFGSHHSDTIITRDKGSAEFFLNRVDSAAVYVNASTRFTDGGEFGFGAEIGISTDKIHARGPMGLAELTTYKYVVRGSGQIRQ